MTNQITVSQLTDQCNGRSLAKTLVADSDTDSEPEVDNDGGHDDSAMVSQLTRLASPFHMPRPSDTTDLTHLSITDEEKQAMIAQAADFSLDNRPFLTSLFNCLDYNDNDYFQLFALCLIYAMQVGRDHLEAQ